LSIRRQGAETVRRYPIWHPHPGGAKARAAVRRRHAGRHVQRHSSRHANGSGAQAQNAVPVTQHLRNGRQKTQVRIQAPTVFQAGRNLRGSIVANHKRWQAPSSGTHNP